MSDQTNILNDGEFDGHIVEPYVFKRVNRALNIKETNNDNSKNIIPQDPSSNNSSISSDEIDKIASFHENLQNKIDKLSRNLLKVQDSISSSKNSLDSDDNISKIQLQKSYQDGLEEGKKQATKEISEQNEEVKARYLQSVSSISNFLESTNKTVDSLQEQLTSTAIDIAKEVISTQIDSNSSLVAKNIATLLLENVKEATSVTLKVSVYDYEYLVDNIKDEKITIEKDLAIAKGGVVLLSDISNIDGSIEERLTRIIKHLSQN